jgi:hypothetical protein
MKKELIVGIVIILLCNSINAQIKMNSAGYIAIGVGANPISGYNLTIGGSSSAYVKFSNPSYSALFIGPVVSYEMDLIPENNNSNEVGTINHAFYKMNSYDFHNCSDERQKENIRNINNALNIVLKLKGVEYDLKKEYVYISPNFSEKRKEQVEKERKNKLGFLAQDVEKILPSVVFHDDSLDMYSMAYNRIIPVLVEAIKELNSKIDSLKQINQKITASLKSAEVKTGIEDSNNQTDVPYLEQNAPNPFSVATTINFYIPQGNQSGVIYIYDMQGLQKKAFSIGSKGKSNIIINGSEFQAGMYLYTLIVDGKEVDTKKMILTE